MFQSGSLKGAVIRHGAQIDVLGISEKPRGNPPLKFISPIGRRQVGCENIPLEFTAAEQKVKLFRAKPGRIVLRADVVNYHQVAVPEFLGHAEPLFLKTVHDLRPVGILCTGQPHTLLGVYQWDQHGHLRCPFEHGFSSPRLATAILAKQNQGFSTRRSFGVADGKLPDRRLKV